MAREYKYIVIGRYAEGVNVLGYVLQDTITGQTNLMPRSTVEELAMNKFIGNISAQIYGGKVILKGLNCKLSSLPNYDSNGNIVTKQDKKCQTSEELKLSARILSGKTTIGYVISVLNNGVECNKKKISREDTMKLARKGLISNARVQMSNGKPVLRGVSCELAKLPSLRK